ncbi:hypothetical protein EC991_004323 [Linnemannia zychae]|nr:hypothetical protein EC991_004323 [Linnemannia zychae]
MALAGFITIIRILIALAAAAVFAVDQYFLYLYRNYDQVVFHWHFYSQVSISGAVFLLVIASETAYRISRYNARDDYYNQYGNSGGKPKSCTCGHFWSIFRFIWAMIFAAGILAWVVPVWMDKKRIMFTIPVSRNSVEANAYRTGRRGGDWINPLNIFDCPEWKDGEPLTYLCKFDQQVMYVSAALAFLLVIEGFFTIIIDTRHRHIVRYNQKSYVAPTTDPNAYTAINPSHAVPMEDLSKTAHVAPTEESPKQTSIFRTLKEHIHREEDHDVESNYGNSGYNPRSNISEARHVGYDVDRSLPPLPAQPTTGTTEEEEEEIRSDSAIIPKPVPVPGPNPFLTGDQILQQQLAFSQASGSSQSPYPADIKRADGA